MGNSLIARGARLAFVATVLAACPPASTPPDDPGEDCISEAPADPSSLPMRALALGGMEGDSFEEWTDGQAVPLVLGSQGFTMITPWVQLPMQADDANGVCWDVELVHLVEGNADPDGLGGYHSGMVFELVDGQMRAGPIFDILEDDDGGALDLRVTVTGPDFQSVDEVTVMPS